jgi:anhydro-N-acetylmuramic acid kinase
MPKHRNEAFNTQHETRNNSPMNDSIRHLCQIADKQQKLIIGLMSGTSMDGLDIALCRISGTGEITQLELQAFETVDYPDEIFRDLREIVSREQVSLQKICLLNSVLGNYHADLILESLEKWNIEAADIDCIASHGQSIYHLPASRDQFKNQPNATLQIIDGDHIARRTGILTISDFRQKHTAAGGEGAPLAALVDELLFAHPAEPRILLNIGGIANFTYVQPQGERNPSITTDTGPGNTLINQAMQELFDKPFDKDGMTARRGSVYAQLLKALLDEPFFSQHLPRTTGPELFNLQWVQKKQQETGAQKISGEDLIATLTWLSAQTIANIIQKVDKSSHSEIYVSGGGMYNKQLIEWLEKLLESPVLSFEDIGFNPDAKEAACFAILANEMLSGTAFTIYPGNGAGRDVNFGKISLPV